MSSFLIRVVLHKTNNLIHPDYITLHAAMEKAGFSRQIESTENVWYHLPSAEYLIYDDRTVQEITLLAMKTAKSVDENYGVIGVEIKGYAYFAYLKEVEG